MKVLVTFAVDAEFAPWRGLRHFEKRHQVDTEFFSTIIEDAEVMVLLTGIGGKKTGVAAAKTLWGGHIDVCISSGLAGALKPEHRLSDILAARRVDATTGKSSVRCDESLVRLALEAGAKIAACFYSVDHVVSSAAEKQELGKTGDAVEMESAEILRDAAALGARVIAIRGISDVSAEDLPLDFNRVTTDSGDVSIKSVLLQMARRPRSIPSLIRFGKQSRLAAEKLSNFLDPYVNGIIRAERVLVHGGVAAP